MGVRLEEGFNVIKPKDAQEGVLYVLGGAIVVNELSGAIIQKVAKSDSVFFVVGQVCSPIELTGYEDLTVIPRGSKIIVT